jgi:large repetitive protein
LVDYYWYSYYFYNVYHFYYLDSGFNVQTAPHFHPPSSVMRVFLLRLLSILVLALVVALPMGAAASTPPPTHVYYVPFPENQQLQAFDAINTVANDPIAVFITIAAATDGTVIFYDHWEDGYETNLSSPVQSTTKVFGDGNPANGYPPGNLSDLIPAGTVFNLRNFVPTSSLGSTIQYDGRDKIASFKPISITKTTFPDGTDTLMAGCVEMFEKGLWGTEYRSPVGVNMPTSAASGNLTFDEDVFNYTAISVMAGVNGASVQVDKDNDGTFEETVVLAEGESFYRDNVNVGGRVLATQPVQVILFTGTVGSSYASRDTSLLPVYRWSSDYFSPISTRTSPTDGTVTYLYNPGATDITVTYDYRSSTSAYTSNTITVPAGGNARVIMSPSDGSTHYGAYRFRTTGGSPPNFYAIGAIDADSVVGGGGSNTAWDGGFTLVGRPSLTTQVLVSLGIGRDPFSTTNPAENGNPIWITTVGNGHTPATVYVDYNGDNAGANTDSNGNHYDVSYSLRELEQLKLFDPDGDQSGMLIYTLDSTVRLAAVWGQDPSLASAAQPGIDVASLVPPLREGDAGKISSLFADTDADGFVSAGDTLEYDIRAVNNSRTSIPGPFKVKDTLPVDTTYVPASTRYRYTIGGVWQGWTSIADDATGTPFPLDGAGFSVPGNLPVGQQLQVTFRAVIDLYADLSAATITNTGEVEISPYGLLLPIAWTDVLYGSIGDRVWNDLDGDGIQDAGENGLAGVDVFIDTNGNGIKDASERGTTTDSNGAYIIAGLRAGTYTVRVDPQDVAAINVGYGPSYDLDGVATSYVANVVLAGAQDRVDVDFGFRIGASVGDRVWVDLDADGVRDSGEPGLNGVRVFIDSDNDNAYDVGEPNSFTFSDGIYYIGNLAAGTYTVRVDTTTLPTLLTQTYDLNGALDHEASVTLIAAEHRGTLDFGYRGTLSIGDLVWDDVNADGLVSIISSTTYTVIDSRIDINGDGNVNNSDDGFIGSMRIINGYVDIDNDASSPVDSSDDGTFLGYTIIDGRVDVNNSGTVNNQDDGSVTYEVYETGIAGVKVFIDYDGDGVLDSNEPFATTNSAGAYTIANLYNGTHSVRVDTTSLPSSYVATYDLDGGLDHRAAVTLAGSSVNNADFGYRNDASIGDLVWNDRDGDGVRDAGEPGMEGIIVYIDDNGNNLFDQATERFVITDATGFYRFTNLPAGTYSIRVEVGTLPLGAVQTYDLDGTGTPHDASRTIATSEDATNVDFGYRASASFGDLVWADADADGVKDVSGEPGIANVRVYLDINGNSVFDSATEPSAITDANGAYTINNLLAGTYTARVDTSTLGAGLVPTYDLVGNPDHSATFSLSASQARTDVDFGYATQASIGDFVWNDVDADGTQDGGELGITGVGITLYNAVDDTVIGTTTSGVNGAYSFTGIMPGTYYLVFDAVAGYSRTYADRGSDTTDSDANVSTGKTANFILAGGNTNTSLDAGYFQPVAIGNFVFNDVNANGQQNGGETGLAGVLVSLFRPGFGADGIAGNADDALAVTTYTTIAGGAYSFSGLPPGTYQVGFGTLAGYARSIANQGVDASDSDANVSTGLTASYTISPGSTDNTVDAGYYQPGTVSGHLYTDTNGDGDQDLGEPNLANVDVVITDVNGFTQTVATNSSGNWTATVPPGSTSANVQESDPQFPTGSTQTEGTDPTTVIVISNTNVSAGNDGYYIPATVTGHLYKDTNGNGTQDGGEPNLANVNVVITNSLGNTSTVTTNSSGDWTASVPPGSTTANVDENDTDFTSVILAGWQQTQGNDPTTVTAVAGSSVSGGIDGYYNSGTVSGHLYIDTNGNGTQNVGEPNLANVDVRITDSNGNIQTVATNSSGNWTATVPPGSTSANVQESDPQFPTGSTQTEGTDPTTVTAVAATNTSAGNDGYYIPATITGHLYRDTNGNGTQDGGEPNLANVRVVITDSNGTTQNVSTNSLGNWTASVPPGSTTVNVDETDTDFTSVVLAGWIQTEGTDPSTVTAVAGTSTSAGNDGYYNPATVTGHLYRDTNGNGTQDGGEPNLSNVDVVVTNSLGNTQTVFTDALGNWSASVPPGSTTANVTEADPDFVAAIPAGYSQTEGTDPTTVTAVAASSVSAGNDGYYNPGTVFGHLYLDTNGNGIQNGGEPNLADVDVIITNSLGNTQTVSTNSSGNWTASVPPGSTSANVNNADPDFPAGVTQTEGTDPTTVTAVAATSVDAGNDGYFLPAIVTGHLYIDSNGNGTQDGAEPDLANIDVIITNSLGNTQTIVTDANGDWTASVPPGSTTANVSEADPDFPASVTQTEGTDPTTVTALAGSTVDGGTDGYFPPATVTGHLYIDSNGDGDQDGGEPNLPNVNVIITTSLGNTLTVSTDSSGNWTASVPPGLTSANVDETDPDFPSNVTQTEGTDPTTVTSITATVVSAGNDGYFPPATVTGHLYFDTNGNGTQDGGEPNLPSINVVITDANNNTQTVATNSSGNWTASVPPGTTSVNVDETDPQFPVGVTQTEGTDPTSVTAVAGNSVSAGNDGYFLPAILTGHLYVDTNGDGNQDSGEPNITNVTVIITDSLGNSQNVFTNGSGNWTASVPPGSTVSNIDNSDPDFVTQVPAGFTQTEGTDPTTTTAIAGSTTNSDNDGFFVPATVTGHLYFDTNGNGAQDGGEPNLPNITVVVTDSNNTVHNISTNSTGDWSVVVPPGSTTANVDEADPQFPAGSTQTQGTDPTTVTAVANSSVNGGIDGYYIPATVTGHLYRDTNGNGIQDGAEPNLANVGVLITDSLGNSQTVSTDALGNWSASVPPGSTTANVTETDPDFVAAIQAGYLQTEGTDPTTVTAVAGSSVSAGNDGYYNPGTVFGHLYTDTNGNGTQDGGEPNLANIDIIITDSLGNTQTVSTNSSGDWTASVPPGSTSANVNNADPDFPVGVTQTEGTDPTSVTAVAASSVDAGNDGYFLPATVIGHLYLDTNGNGTQDSGEADLANVDVIITDSLSNTRTVSTNGDGDWTATVPPGSTSANVDETDPQFPTGVTQTEGTDPTTFTAVAGSSVNGGIDGYFLPAIVTGHLYLDTNGDGDQDSGEPNITDVTVVITDSLDNTQTLSTNSQGNWSASVPPGSTVSNIDNNDPDFIAQVPAGSSQTEGTDPTTTNVVAGVSTHSDNDGFFVPATVTGHLYLDTNGNGTQDGGEPNLPNITVVVTDSNNTVHNISTDSTGDWSVVVPPGSTSANVDETDPQFPAGSTQTQGTDPTTVTAVANSSVNGGIDGYYIPATVTGHLYKDTNGNGIQDGAEPNLANVGVLITDSLGNTQTVSTNSSGSWSASVPPGSTSANVNEADTDFTSVIAAGYIQTEGTDPTTVTAVAGSSVSAGNDGYFNPGTVFGHVYLDTNGNGTQDSGEPDLEDIDVVITDSLGNTQTVFTNSNGDWSASVPPGTTSANVNNADPDLPAGVTQTEGTDPTTFTAVAGSSVNGGIDGYFLPALVTGHLYLDTNGDGDQDAGEPNITDVTVIITDSLGNTQNVSTNASGDWTASVPPGSTVSNINNSDPDFISQVPAGSTQTEGTDPTTTTAVAGASTPSDNDGFFAPATVTGHLYLDTNGNGTQDGGEPNLPNVDVVITDSNGNTQTVFTNSAGNWTASVPPGSTIANVSEADPEFPAGVTQTEGTDPTNVTAVVNSSVSAGNDGYFLPATISGHLYRDTNGNGVQDGAEPDLANVDVLITNSLNATFTVTTNSNGDWSASVPPGSTTANVVETDSDFMALVLAGYIQTEGADPTTVTAVAGSNVDAGIDGYYNPATVTGHLYFDTNGNGTQDSGEPDLADVDVLITDSLSNTQTVSSDSNGDWTASVPPGSTSANVQESDADFPPSVSQTEGTDPTVVTAVAATSVSAGNDGYTPVPGLFSISGQVRDDFDSDGSFSDNDTAVSGVTINLYRDINGNGQIDSGDALLGTTTTGSNGQYQFTGLANGSYLVEEDDPRPSTSTADVEGANDNLIPVTIAGANVTGRDFLDAVDPHGYFYDTETGEIIPGGSISVSGPGTITIAQNGSTGQYSWLADTTGAVYTMTVTVPAGYTLDPSRPALSGPYNPTTTPNPNVLGSGENPSAPGTLTNFSAGANPWYLTFVFDAGDPLIINNNIPLLKNKPLTYTGWRARWPLGGQNNPADDPDGDGYDNVQEFAFCYTPNNGTSTGCPVTLTVQPDGRVDLNVRRVIGITGVSYVPEYISALASSGANGAGWTDLTTIVPVVTNLNNGKETATYQGVSSLPALVSGTQGFFRVRVELDSNGDAVTDTISRTKTAGYSRRTISGQCETYSMPYFGCPPAAGIVDSVAGSMLNSTTSIGMGSIVSSLTVGRQYYIEFTSGENAGHRVDLDEANTTATMLAVDAASPHNTLTSLPASLAGDHWSIRPHHTFNELFPPAKFTNATNDPNTADRLSLKSGAGFTLYWLFRNGNNPIWVDAADDQLADKGGTILPPGVGAYVRPRTGTVALTLSGFVRTNPFARPLTTDSPLVGGGWPMEQTLNTRGMTTANGFMANRSSTVASRLILWKGDTTPNAQGYDTYSYLSFGANLHWITLEDATLNSVSNQNLLRSTRAGFIKVSTPLPNYLMPTPWTP